jgi:TrkA domain protein
MDIQETTLPGVGLRHDFTTRDGRRLGVVSYRSGRRDLLLYDPDDVDTCQEVIRLTQEGPTPWLTCWAPPASSAT